MFIEFIFLSPNHNAKVGGINDIRNNQYNLFIIYYVNKAYQPLVGIALYINIRAHYIKLCPLRRWLKAWIILVTH